MKRPKLKIKPKPFDTLIEIIGAIGIIILITLPFLYYSELPDIIPRHFNASGEPDGFGGKTFIWTLPVIGVLLYLGMAILNRYPHIFNYLQEITEENAYQQYKNAIRMVRILNTTIACTFAYIMYIITQTAKGTQMSLGTYFTPVFILLIFGISAYFIYKSFKLK